MIEQPPDQELTVDQFFATTNRKGENPPTLTLMIDVQHAEVGTTWRQQLMFTRDQWVNLMQLLAYACTTEGVEWQT